MAKSKKELASLFERPWPFEPIAGWAAGTPGLCPTRAVMLRLLGQKCNRHFAGVWEFVDWAQEHRPDLDLTTPPKRPQR